jgi:hypothetical protein
MIEATKTLCNNSEKLFVVFGSQFKSQYYETDILTIYQKTFEAKHLVFLVFNATSITGLIVKYGYQKKWLTNVLNCIQQHNFLYI